MEKSVVGSIGLNLELNKKPFEKQMNGLQGSITKTCNTLSVALGNLLADFTKKALVGLKDFLKESINEGSDIAEVANVVEATFTTMSGAVDKFAKNALDQFGLNELQAKKMIGTYGAMSKAFGYTEQEAFNMSTALAGLTGDMASFYNLDIDQAYTKAKAVFTGETEALKDIGVVMTQAALQEYALSKGISKTVDAMTEKEKVSLRLGFLTDKLSVASGDVVRTQDSWANLTRKLNGQLSTLKANIGQGLINILKPLVMWLNEVIAKLIQAAAAFKTFTDRLAGKKEATAGNGEAVKAVAEATSDISSNTSASEEAMTSFGKAAKKASKDMMAFDILYKLADEASNATDSGIMNLDNTLQAKPAENVKDEESIKYLDELKAKISDISNILNLGFNEGLGKGFDDSIKKLKSGVDGIKTSFISIFTDGQVLHSLTNFIDSVSFNLGKIAGSGVSIATSLGTNIVTGIDTYLKENQPLIKQKLVKLFDIGSEMATIQGYFVSSLSDIAKVLEGPEATSITSSIIGIFSNSFLSSKQLSGEFALDLMTMIEKPIIDNSGKIKTALENTFKPLSDIMKTFKDTVDMAWDEMIKTYDEEVGPMLESFAEGFSEILSTILDAYNEYVVPVIDKLSTELVKVLESDVASAIKKVIEVIGKLCKLIKSIWNEYLSPFINWVVETFGPLWAKTIEVIGSSFINKFSSMFKKVEAAYTVIGGIVDFLTDIVNNGWSKACSNLSTKFKSAFTIVKDIANTALDAVGQRFTNLWTIVKTYVNFILGGVEKMANGIVKGLNTAIKAINNLSIDIPEWVPSVGGNSIGFNMKPIGEIKIDKLAQGGYVKKNTPQLAMIGDNKRYGEIVAPENKLEDMALKAAKLAGGGSSSEIVRLLRELIQLIRSLEGDTILMIGDEEVASASRRGQAVFNKRFSTTG